MEITLAALQNKWREVPYGSRRRYSADLLGLDDDKLYKAWQDSCIHAMQHRFWYHGRLNGKLMGKKVLDVGCGLAYDSLQFALRGAVMTFSDIVPDNLKVVERLCKMFNVNAVFLLIEGNHSFDKLGRDYDAVIAIGSLHHAPEEYLRPEVHTIVKHLKPGGMWWQLAYPKSRLGSWLPCWLWGRITDGLRTPWAEWYDVDKLLDLMKPHVFELVSYEEYNREFNAIELVKVG